MPTQKQLENIFPVYLHIEITQQNFHIVPKKILNIVVEWLTLLHRIWEVPGSILNPAQPAILIKVSRGFPQSLQANVGILP
jgi:hypothetical protein